METGYKELTFHIKGIVPLLLHNGLLSDPLDQRSIALSKAVKAAGKSKTEDNLAEMARVEFMGGLYVDENGAPCIPGEVLEACIRSGAKQTKDGKAVQAGLFADGNFPILYTGPKEPDAMWEARGPGKHVGPMAGRVFVDRRRCRVGQSAVMRTRPIFRDWSLIFTVSFDPTIMNADSVKDFVAAAGRCGLCEMRPRFGRFEVVEVS
jgi:hypothetical protein